MKSFRDFVQKRLLEMQNVKYDFSSVHINLPDHLAREIVAWGTKAIPNEDLFIDDNNGFVGRENEIHVTVLYGIHSDSADKTKELMAEESTFEIELGSIGLFENNDLFDVVKIGVNSDALHRLNAKFQKKMPFTNKYHKYQPHVTIAYVKKGKAIKLRGVKEFLGTKFLADHVVFSSKKGTKEKILFGPA